MKRSTRYVRCETNVANRGNGCGRLSAIHTIEYIRTHWYVRPYSCTGGDYWNEGEGQFICPKCGYRNRLICSGVGEKIVMDDPKRSGLQELQYQFKSIKDEY